MWFAPEDSLSAIQLSADISVDLESISGVGLGQVSDPCCCCGVEPDAIGLAWKPVAVSGGYSGGAEPRGVGFVFAGVVFDWLRV